MEMEISGEDRISDLPLFILHDILRRLPYEDAATTCLLSKRWLYVKSLYPNLEFVVDGEDLKDFVGRIDKSLHRLVDNGLLIRRFTLCCSIKSESDLDHLNRWLQLVMDNGVSKLHLSVTTETETDDDHDHDHDSYNPYSLPKTTFVPKFVPRFYNLQNIYLSQVRVSEGIIRNIIENCPNLKLLSLCFIYGLKNLEISNLRSLETLTVDVARGVHELESVRVINAPNLKRFCYTSYELDLPCEINLTSCHRLEYLHLGGCVITDELFQLLLSNFPRLKTLSLDACRMLERVKISAQRLTDLSISTSEMLKTVEIDAPNLSLFSFHPHTMPIFISENVHCPMKIRYFLGYEPMEIATSWFLKLREFLGACTKIRKVLELDIQNVKVSFNLKEFEEVNVIPNFKLEELKLRSTYDLGFLKVDHETLVDALLCVCHPKTIYVDGEKTRFNSPLCLKALCEKLLGNKPPMCCIGSNVKCWRHDLKSAKIEYFGEIKDEKHLLDWKNLLDTMPEYTKISFTLLWNF